MEQTFSIIKPDAVKRNIAGKIITKFEDAGLRVAAIRKIQMTEDVAKEFYKVHAERPFYHDLVAYMISGPVIVQVLEGENAVVRNREIMGATNPKDAAAGTIRAEFGLGIEENSVHGSDSLENALKEISFFFGGFEIY